MKQRFLIVALSVIALCFSGLKKEDNFITGHSVAVVELFTTEACSSCPAADEMLKEMVELTQKEGKHVMGLAFHVTYFNHLGWVDPYSNEEFTKRQKKYREALNVETLYTPQAIVNGQYEFLGSNVIGFRSSVDKACTEQVQYNLEAKAKAEGDSLILEYTLDKKPRNEIINIAIVENHIERKIGSGENKSKTLKHYNVVRKFETRKLDLHDSMTLKMPDDLESENSSVILYVQHKWTMKILGAVAIDLSQAKAK